MAIQEIGNASGPLCDSLAGYWRIKNVWELEDGSLALCVDGVPWRMAREYGNADPSESEPYSVTISADILNRHVTTDERQLGWPYKIVRLPKTATGPSCPTPKDSWRTVPLHDLGTAGRKSYETLDQTYRPGETVEAIFFEPKVEGDPPQYSRYSDKVLIMRAGTGGVEERLVAYEFTPEKGHISWGNGFLLAAAFVFDIVTIGMDLQGDGTGTDTTDDSSLCVM